MNPAIAKAEQELQELRLQEAVLTENARLLTAQKEWLGDLIQHLAELAEMVGSLEYVTVSEAHERYWCGKLSLRWWYRAAETGLVPCVRAGSVVLFRRDDLNKLEREGTAPTAPPAPPTPTASGPKQKPQPTTVTVFKHFPK